MSLDDFRADEALVGLIALASIYWIVSLLRRASRTGRMPIGRGLVFREERRGAFRTLFGVYLLAAFVMLYIGLDLLFGIGAFFERL